MSQALKLAKKAFDSDEIPLGCVIVEDNKIIASSHNETILQKNPLAHAEILAIQSALKKKNCNFLTQILKKSFMIFKFFKIIIITNSSELLE